MATICNGFWFNGCWSVGDEHEGGIISVLLERQ
jgi:hypothetical protein